MTALPFSVYTLCPALKQRYEFLLSDLNNTIFRNVDLPTGDENVC